MPLFVNLLTSPSQLPTMMCITNSPRYDAFKATNAANPQSPTMQLGTIPRKTLQPQLSQPHPFKLRHQNAPVMERAANIVKRKHENNHPVLSSASSQTHTTVSMNDSSTASKRRKFLSHQIEQSAKIEKQLTIPILRKKTENSNNSSTESNQHEKYSLFSVLKSKRTGVAFAASAKTKCQTRKLGGSAAPSDRSIKTTTLSHLISNLRKGMYTIEHQKKFLATAKQSIGNYEHEKVALLYSPFSSKDSAQKVLKKKIERFHHMRSALKVFIAAEIALERTSRYLSRTADGREFKCKRNEYARQLVDDVLKQMTQFQKDTKKICQKPLIDVNTIALFGGITFLHTAVLLYDEAIIHQLLKSGIDKNFRSEEYGTAMDLAWTLSTSAHARGDSKMAMAYKHIFRMLE